MSKKRKKRPSGRSGDPPNHAQEVVQQSAPRTFDATAAIRRLDERDIRYTGRHLIVFANSTDTAKHLKFLSSIAGSKVATTSDFDRGSRAINGDIKQGIYFERLGIAVISGPIAQASTAAQNRRADIAVVPERFFFTPGAADFPDSNAEELRKSVGSADEFTWGVEMTGVSRSHYTGAGIKVCVLDSGFDESHPDFAGRTILTRSFVGGETTNDLQGHGTHCVGVACGPRRPAPPPGYGCANNAEIFVGKVLSDSGTGTDESILNGIEWAIRNGCHIVSMSLESLYDPSSPTLPQYERAGDVAMKNGVLLIAAAGNDSQRPSFTRYVANPASATTIMAVAAIDIRSAVAPFSCVGREPPPPQVDVCAPGVNIDSSWPMPRGRRISSGTSMAAPYAAGIAALHAEAHPHSRGRELWNLLLSTAKPVGSNANDVGTGLVQAP
jgi:subtilisin family serine protease